MPVFCIKKSKIKMVILLKNGQEHLKIYNKSGKLINPVWYSIISKDSKNIDIIISQMKERFLKSKFVNAATMLIFYNNTTKQELKRIKL